MSTQMDKEFLEAIAASPDSWQQVAARHALTIMRLREIVRAPLSPTEMKLVDKHCDWIAFQHAWNAVMKGRRIALDGEQTGDKHGS